MIRVNLLRVRALKESRQASGAVQLLGLLACVALEVAAIMFFHMRISKDVKAVKAKTDELSGMLSSQKSKMSDNDAKREELEAITKKHEVIAELEARRTGPQAMLGEVTRVLSKGGSPTMDDETEQDLRRQNLLPGFNKAWDWRKLWVDKFTETDREVTLQGKALDVEDITEFQRRLNLSQYFEDIRWVRSPEQRSVDTGETLYEFTLQGRAVF